MCRRASSACSPFFNEINDVSTPRRCRECTWTKCPLSVILLLSIREKLITVTWSRLNSALFLSELLFDYFQQGTLWPCLYYSIGYLVNQEGRCVKASCMIFLQWGKIELKREAWLVPSYRWVLLAPSTNHRSENIFAPWDTILRAWFTSSLQPVVDFRCARCYTKGMLSALGLLSERIPLATGDVAAAPSNSIYD